MSYTAFLHPRGRDAAINAAYAARSSATGPRDWQRAGFFEKVSRTGSREICDPPPLDTDEDFICKSRPSFEGEQLEALGFSRCSLLEYEGDKFRAFRRGDVNLIITPSEAFYDRFVLATDLAKRFNLLDKSNRIALFEAVVDDYFDSEE